MSLKVLSVIETLGHGGAETVATNLAIGLARGSGNGGSGGIDSRLAHLSHANQRPPYPRLLDRMQAAGIPVHDVHWRDLQRPELRKGLFGGWQPDVVIFHWWRNHPLTPWLEDGAAGRPVFIAVLHHQGDPGGPLYDHYVAVTPSQLPRLNARQRRQARVIPNGIDLSPYTRPRAHHHGRFTIGRLSSLRPGKLPEDWIGISAGFRIPDAHWVIAGDGRLRQSLQADVERLDLAGQYEFPGYIEEHRRAALFARFTVGCYVTGHLGEAHPLSVMETAAAGVPIVANRCGGIPDIIEHGVNGLLGDSHREVGQHLRRLRADPALRRVLADGARETAAERFSVATQVAAYRSLLVGLAGFAG